MARQAGKHVTLAAIALLLMAQSAALLAASTTGASPSATTNSTAKTETSLVVQSPYVEPPAPESLFVMPKVRADGKDPFFPKSTAYLGIEPTTTKTGPAPIVAELILRGISGSDEKPLAIINTTTFGVGDELDVTTKAGKLRVRCLEIDKAAGTASVQMGGERRELRLPPLK